MIVDNDKYQTLGMVSIVKKIFTSLGFKKEIKFYRKAFYSADVIFIGVDEFSFFEALKRLDKTPAEADVFSGGDIARILKKSEKTVSGQKRSAMKKLGARTDVELIKMFMFK